ncbi:MAG: PspC domain-containing protein [Candidatus Limnocylindria bacterium]
MTTEQPTDPAPTAAASVRPLRRRGSERVLGGVASGIADYFNVDPLLVRAAFVGLMVFGGSGLVLYVLAWILIPVEGDDASVAEQAVGRLGLSAGWAIGIIALIAFLVFWLGLPHRGDLDMTVGSAVGSAVSLLVVVLIVVLGISLIRRGGGTTPSSNIVATSDVVTADAAGHPVVQRTVVVRERRPHVPRGPLGWYTVAAALIGVGLLAILDNASDLTVMPGQFFGLALTVVGIGLVIGSWWGNARLLILPAFLLLPVAWAFSYVTVPMEGGTGNQEFSPASLDELDDEYRLMSGRLTLDLRDLEAGNEPVEVSASVAFGTLNVLLPAGAQVEVDSHVGAGGSNILGSHQNGTDVTERYVRGEDGPHFVLDLGTGIGYIWVEEYR